MTCVDAIYQDGVFKPLGAVGVAENQRVHLNIELANGSDARAWLARVQSLHQQLVSQNRYLPDSTPEISADRLR